MQFFYYLYLVVVHIHSQQIKVMKLKAYLQLQKSEIPSQYPIDNLSSIETLNLFDTSTIITGTGTTGDTTIVGGGINIGIITMDTLITVSIIMAVIIAHLLDRKFNRETFPYQE